MNTKFLKQVQKHYYGNSDEVNQNELTKDINAFLKALKEDRLFFIQNKYTTSGYCHITLFEFNVINEFGKTRNFNQMLLAFGFERGVNNIKILSSTNEFTKRLVNRINKMGFDTNFEWSYPRTLCF